MATCKECVHVEVCRYYTNELAKENGIPLKLEEVERLLECDDCENFKDRSRFVELPCKVGDTVYLLHNVYKNILAYSVSKILINSGEPIIEIVEDKRRIHILHIPARKLNNSLFLTKEQAEQALKEREENDKQKRPDR